MVKSDRNSGKPWTDTDVNTLKELSKGNTPTGVMSIKLGRTETAIYAKAAELKVPLKPVNQSPYNRKAK